MRRQFCALGLLVALPGHADERPSDQQVKAAYLARFGAYVEWPEEGGAREAPLLIGVLGAETLAHELEQLLRMRRGGERAIQVLRMKSGDSAKGLHMLLVGAAVTQPLPQQHGLLTVSDGPPGRGAVIQFLLADQKVRFEIDLAAAERNGLRLSSRLLGVALRVVGGGN